MRCQQYRRSSLARAMQCAAALACAALLLPCAAKKHPTAYHVESRAELDDAMQTGQRLIVLTQHLDVRGEEAWNDCNDDGNVDASDGLFCIRPSNYMVMGKCGAPPAELRTWHPIQPGQCVIHSDHPLTFHVASDQHVLLHNLYIKGIPPDAQHPETSILRLSDVGGPIGAGPKVYLLNVTLYGPGVGTDTKARGVKIDVVNAKLYARDSVFVKLREGMGPAAYIFDGAAAFERCTFDSNMDTFSKGAAIFADQPSATVLLKECVLGANHPRDVVALDRQARVFSDNRHLPIFTDIYAENTEDVSEPLPLSSLPAGVFLDDDDDWLQAVLKEASIAKASYPRHWSKHWQPPVVVLVTIGFLLTLTLASSAAYFLARRQYVEIATSENANAAAGHKVNKLQPLQDQELAAQFGPPRVLDEPEDESFMQAAKDPEAIHLDAA